MFRIIVFVAALLCGGLAAWMTFAWQPSALPAEGSGQAVVAAPAEEVLVAAAALSQGQVLDASSMRWQSWPEDSPTESMIVRSSQPGAIDSYQGSIVRGGFVSGEPIREEKLVPDDSGFLSAILSSGKRAIAVRISAENTAGGFILPNDHVDVVHTTQIAVDDGGTTRTVSRTILRNIRVLAIDQNADGSGTGAVVVGKTATLELSPEQVEIAAAAESSGALSLALRSVEDIDEAEMVAIAESDPAEPADRERVVTLIQSGVTEQVRTQASSRN